MISDHSLFPTPCYFPPSQPCQLFLILTQSPTLALFCDPFVTIGLQLFHWSLTKSPVSTKLKVPLSLNVPAENRSALGWRLRLSSICTWALVGLFLCRPRVGLRSCSDFVLAMPVPCLGDYISNSFPLSSGS